MEVDFKNWSASCEKMTTGASPCSSHILIPSFRDEILTCEISIAKYQADTESSSLLVHNATVLTNLSAGACQHLNVSHLEHGSPEVCCEWPSSLVLCLHKLQALGSSLNGIVRLEENSSFENIWEVVEVPGVGGLGLIHHDDTRGAELALTFQDGNERWVDRRVCGARWGEIVKSLLQCGAAAEPNRVCTCKTCVLNNWQP